MKYPATGSHLLLTLTNCNPDLLSDVDALQRLVVEAATATGATVLQVVTQRFEPQGVTVLAVLAESHASLHTYPESGVVFWDCFTCGQTCKPERSTAVLTAALSPSDVESTLVSRGIKVLA